MHWALSLLVCFWVVVSLCTEKENLSRILSTAISEIICAMQNVFKIFSPCRSNFMPSKQWFPLPCQSNIFLCLEFSFGGLHGGGWKGGQSVSQQQNLPVTTHKTMDLKENHKPQLNTRVIRRVRKVQYQNPEFHPVFPFS